MSSPEESVVAAFRIQSAAFKLAGASLSVHLSDAAFENLRQDGVVAQLFRAWSGDAIHDYFPLRLVAAAHSLALRGQAPDLASHYPTCGGIPHLKMTKAVFLDVLSRHVEEVQRFIRFSPQTNEVGRSAALFGGFHLAALRAQLPLRLLELGASAGLNLYWDHYRYELGKSRWGPKQSPVCLRPQWSGPSPPVDQDLTVGSRVGCDLNPIDLRDEDDRLRLESYVWADQPDRLERLRSAIQHVLPNPPFIHRASAVPWLQSQLREPSAGLATVVFHSAFWPYLQAEEQETLESLILGAGEAASTEAPLAWLRYEGLGKELELRLELWPGGDSLLLARGENRGYWVRWEWEAAQQAAEADGRTR